MQISGNANGHILYFLNFTYLRPLKQLLRNDKQKKYPG